MRPLYALLAALAALLVGITPALALPADDTPGPGTQLCADAQTAVDTALDTETTALAPLAGLDTAVLADLGTYLATLDPTADADLRITVQAAIDARAAVTTATAARDTACATPAEPAPTTPPAQPGQPCTIAGVTGTTSDDGDCLIGNPTRPGGDDALPVGGVDTGDGSRAA